MKKIVFVMPLMAISLLMSCGSGSVSTLPIKYSQYQQIKGEILLVSEGDLTYNDKGLLIKDSEQYTQADIQEIHEYEYDEKGNMTKDTLTYIEGGEPKDSDVVTYTYTYDQKNRITKEIETHTDISYIIDYTYESDLTDWITYKYKVGDNCKKDITRTFKDGLYVEAFDSIANEYYYYTWDEHRCNTKIEIYDGEGKTPSGHLSDETYEYHKNMPNKIKKYVLSYYQDGEIESSETTQTDYDNHDRVIKISNYDEEVLNSYTEYKYKD